MFGASWRLSNSVRVLCVQCRSPLGACSQSCAPGACAVSVATWRLFRSVRARCVVCAMSLAFSRLYTGVRAWCVVCAVPLPAWRLFTDVRAWCVVSVVSLATWHFFSSVRAQCVPCAGSRPLGSCLCAACAFCVVLRCFAPLCVCWFLRAPGVLARPMHIWCGLCFLSRSRFLGTWSCALVVAGGVTLWRAS